MTKEFWKAALIRAVRTIAQTLVGMIPAGMIITPKMVESADISTLYIIVAWLLTGLASGIVSLLTSIAFGLPEVEKNEKKK